MKNYWFYNKPFTIIMNTLKLTKLCYEKFHLTTYPFCCSIMACDPFTPIERSFSFFFLFFFLTNTGWFLYKTFIILKYYHRYFIVHIFFEYIYIYIYIDSREYNSKCCNLLINTYYMLPQPTLLIFKNNCSRSCLPILLFYS